MSTATPRKKKSVATGEHNSLRGSSRIRPGLFALGMLSPRVNSVATNRIGVVVLHTRHDTRGVVVEELRVRLFPAIGHRSAAYQERGGIVPGVLQLVEGRDCPVARMAIQHAVIATGLVLDPRITATMDNLSDRHQGFDDDGIKGSRSGRVVLRHCPTMPYRVDRLFTSRARCD